MQHYELQQAAHKTQIYNTCTMKQTFYPYMSTCNYTYPNSNKNTHLILYTSYFTTSLLMKPTIIIHNKPDIPPTFPKSKPTWTISNNQSINPQTQKLLPQQI